MTDNGTALNSQRSHWEETLSKKPEMFGHEPSALARESVKRFQSVGVGSVLELGGGQGRDTFFFARQGFEVTVLDYSKSGISAIRDTARALGLDSLVTAIQHDVREPLPVEDGSFDACYSHMLFCMALSFRQLQELSLEIRRILVPGGLHVYSVRNTSDPHYRTGIPRGEEMYEVSGFIVHFFTTRMVESLAEGYEVLCLDEFEESPLPRRLFRVELRKGDTHGA